MCETLYGMYSDVTQAVWLSADVWVSKRVLKRIGIFSEAIVTWLYKRLCLYPINTVISVYLRILKLLKAVKRDLWYHA